MALVDLTFVLHSESSRLGKPTGFLRQIFIIIICFFYTKPKGSSQIHYQTSSSIRGDVGLNGLMIVKNVDKRVEYGK